MMHNFIFKFYKAICSFNYYYFNYKDYVRDLVETQAKTFSYEEGSYGSSNRESKNFNNNINNY